MSPHISIKATTSFKLQQYGMEKRFCVIVICGNYVWITEAILLHEADHFISMYIVITYHMRHNKQSTFTQR